MEGGSRREGGVRTDLPKLYALVHRQNFKNRLVAHQLVATNEMQLSTEGAAFRKACSPSSQSSALQSWRTNIVASIKEPSLWLRHVWAVAAGMRKSNWNHSPRCQTNGVVLFKTIFLMAFDECPVQCARRASGVSHCSTMY